MDLGVAGAVGAFGSLELVVVGNVDGEEGGGDACLDDLVVGLVAGLADEEVGGSEVAGRGDGSLGEVGTWRDLE